MSELIPGPQLARRLLEAERDCYVAWAEALAAEPGNPLGASVHQLGSATVVLCPGTPAQIVNRVFGLTAADEARIPAILDLFSRHDVPVSIDVDPYGEGALLAALARHGLRQTGFHQMIYGWPRATKPEQKLRIEKAGVERKDEFAGIHEKVWGPGGLITPLLRHPEFQCYIAFVGDEPAALGVLHVKGPNASMANAITIPQFRGRGIQAALLQERLWLAQELGCDLIVSQASPRNVSLRNQIRAGLL